MESGFLYHFGFMKVRKCLFKKGDLNELTYAYCYNVYLTNYVQLHVVYLDHVCNVVFICAIHHILHSFFCGFTYSIEATIVLLNFTLFWFLNQNFI